MNQYLAMGRNYRTHDEVMAALIYPIFLERAEEGRKARFHKYLEAHLEEFWPIHKRILPVLEPDPLLKIYDRQALDGVNYEKDLPHGGKLVTLVHVQR
jgi:hypothetical protein